MKKMLFLLSFFAITTHAQENNSQSPTLEQLTNSKSAKISFECTRDENVNLHAWQEIVVAVNNLIELCYTSDSDDSLEDTVTQEVHKTIDYIRNIQKANIHHGIHGLLVVSVGQVENEQTVPEMSLQ